jgi:hypothetical protein
LLQSEHGARVSATLAGMAALLGALRQTDGMPPSCRRLARCAV